MKAYALFFAMVQGIWVFTTGCATAAPVEVVESVPLESTLAVPGIRQTQEVWLEMINAAQSTIDLEQFYINNSAGQSLEPVLNALKAAAARGVQIRFILDLKFLKTYPDVPNALSNLPNFQVESIDFSNSGGIQHAKYIVVDQQDTFIGSANFDWLALSHIHEVGLRLKDSDLSKNLEDVFNTDWAVGSPVGGTARLNFKPKPRPPLHAAKLPSKQLPGIQLFASPAFANPTDVPSSITGVTDLMNSAQKTLKIQVYEYTTTDAFSPTHSKWDLLDAAIRSAAARGVHVQVMVDNVAMKSGGKDLKALAQLPNVEVKTVIIPVWSGGAIPYARLIHSKYFVVDGNSGWVGTENWSEGYFMNSRNVGIILHTPALANSLGQIYDQVWSSAYATQLK